MTDRKRKSAPPKEREAPYHHGQLREACLREGLRFVARGNTQFSLRDLARKIGVSHQAPYHHFRSRGELLADIAQDGFLRFGADLRTARLAGGDGATLLKRMCRAYLDFALKHPHHYHLMFASSEVDFFSKPDTGLASKASFDELLAAVDVLQSEGQFRGQLNADVAASIWSWTHGVAMLLIHGRLEFLSFKAPLSTEDFERLYAPQAALFDRGKD